MDVFQHHDGVVHHQADGQHQPQQGQGVDGEAQGVQKDECTDQRHRDGHEWNQRRPPVAQEQENHRHHQRQRLHHGAINRLDGFLDEDRAVVANLDLHPLWQAGLNTRQQRPHRLRHAQGVSGGLLDHAQRHRGIAVDPHRVALVRRADFGVTNVAQPDRIALGFLENQIVELLRRAQIRLGQHRELALARFDAAGGQFDVLLLQSVFHVLRGQAVGGHPVAVQPQPHGVAPLAADDHAGHPRQRLQAVHDVAVGVIGDLQRAVTLAGKRQPHNRLGVGLDLGHHRILGLIRQLTAHPRHPVAHVVGGGVHVPLQQELDRDLADLLAADRFDGANAFDAGQRILQRLSDLAFHDFGAGARIDRAHRHHRRVDVGIFAHRQPQEGDDADQNDGEAHHRRQHRALDAEFGEEHG